MGVSTVYADAADGHIVSSAGTYAAARAGTGSFFVHAGGSTLQYGQDVGGPTYSVTEAFARWSYAPSASEVIVSAAFRFWHSNVNATATARDLEVRQAPWIAPLDASDYKVQSTLSGLPLLAAVRSAHAASGRYCLAGSTALTDALRGGAGTLYATLVSSRLRGGNTPLGDENSLIYASEASGTDLDPAIIYTSAPRSGLFGVLGASVRLSDGSWMVLESDGAAAPTLLLRRHTGSAVTTVDALPTANVAGQWGIPRGAQSYALAVDASDNVYVVGVAGAPATSIAVRAWRKSGATWTPEGGGPVTISPPAHTGDVNNVAAAWHATGNGGTLVVIVGHAAGHGDPDTSVPDLAYLTLSASTLAVRASGAAPVAARTNAQYHNTFANETGTCLDVIADGATAGYLVTHVKGAVLGQAAPLALTRYEVSAAGAVTAMTRVSDAWGGRDAGAKVRAVATGSGTMAVVTADPRAGYGLTVLPYRSTVFGWTALAPAVRLDEGVLATMPTSATLATSQAWDVVYVPHTNKLWIYYPDAADARTIRRTGVDLTTYQPTREEVAVVTVGAAGGTNLAMRVDRGSAATSRALLSVAHRASGGALSTTYHVDSYNVAPSPPVLTERENFDAAGAAVLAWTFVDANLGDTQSAYQVQIINASTSASVVDTGKVASATTSHTIAGGTLANGTQYQWRARAWDALDAAGGWSGYGTFSTGAGGAVTITDPAVNNPAGVNTDDYLIKWTVAGTAQDAYRVWVVRLDTGATSYESGWVTSTATQHSVVGMVSGVEHEVRVTVRNASAVVSSIGTRRITPVYDSPDVPTLAVESMGAGGYVLVMITNPAPQGDRPSPLRNEVWRRVVGEPDYAMIGTVEPGQEYRDYTAAPGVPYEYRARAVA